VADDLKQLIRAVVADDGGTGYAAEGDEWLYRPNPDEAELMVDALTDALTTAVTAWMRRCG